MGVLVGKHKNVYPAAKSTVKGKMHTKKQPDSYMDQLTRSFLANFRAFTEAAKQS